MHEFVTDLAIVLGVAAVTGVVAKWLKQPTVLGYLFAGLIVGPYLPIPIFADPHRIETLSALGVVLVMFSVGLEFRLARLLQVLPGSGLTGLVQVSFLLWCGFSLGQLLGWTSVGSLFLGACIAISSTMVVSRVFTECTVDRDVRQHVFGVLVLQDVVAIVLIAAMTAVAAGQGLSARDLMIVLGRLGGVLLGLGVFGLLIVPKVIRGVLRLESPEILTVVSVGLCFVLAVIAEELGYSLALGAFLGGILVAESRKGNKVEHAIEPIRDLFAAIFFVSIGMSVDPRQALAHLPVSLLLFVVVVGAQLGSVSIVGILSGHGLRRSIVSGLALGQIGEFAFIIGGIGVVAGVAPPELQPILVTVAVLTAFTTPLFLRASERIVYFVDRKLPHRAQHLLGIYDDWLERFRKRPATVKRASPLARAVRSVGFDALVLLLLVALEATWLREQLDWIRETLGVSSGMARLLVTAGITLICLPFLIALVRNTIRLARLVGQGIGSGEASTSTGAAVAASTVQGMIVLAVVLGVGSPMIAVLRPVTGTFYGFGLLAGVVLILLVRLWRRVGSFEDEYRTGAAEVAGILARQAAGTENDGVDRPELLPGLDQIVGLGLPKGSWMVGKTLAEVNLRARTGATVVAIQRQGSQVVLPTGRETLMAGDVLAMTGTTSAIREAEQFLVNGQLAVAR
ncbi:MAG: cation:proton antiporter [Planctomycetota bacterium]